MMELLMLQILLIGLTILLERAGHVTVVGQECQLLKDQLTFGIPIPMIFI